MKKQFVFGFILVAGLALASFVPSLKAGGGDCEVYDTSYMEPLDSTQINFTCTTDTTVYFGTCDSGGVPNDDLFEVVYKGSVVAFNLYLGDVEYASIGSAQVTGGSHIATLNSLNVAVEEATYSYAVSPNFDNVSDYLDGVCGVDFGGLPVTACSYGPRNVPVFTTDTAPSAGTLEFRILLGNEANRQQEALFKTWDISAGQQLNNEMVYNLLSPRWARVWWQPDGSSTWYLLTSQYWHDDNTSASEYGITCSVATLPSYHTSFASAVPESEVCFDLVNGCN